MNSCSEMLFVSDISRHNFYFFLNSDAKKVFDDIRFAFACDKGKRTPSFDEIRLALFLLALTNFVHKI